MALPPRAYTHTDGKRGGNDQHGEPCQQLKLSVVKTLSAVKTLSGVKTLSAVKTQDPRDERVRERTRTRTYFTSVMERGSVEGQDTGSGVRKNGDHSRRPAAIRFYLLSRRQFSAPPNDDDDDDVGLPVLGCRVDII